MPPLFFCGETPWRPGDPGVAGRRIRFLPGPGQLSQSHPVVYQPIPFQLESNETPARNAPETMAPGFPRQPFGVARVRLPRPGLGAIPRPDGRFLPGPEANRSWPHPAPWRQELESPSVR